jgi:hypothetical protein
VAAVRADGELMNSGAVRCMVDAARRWELPALGASVELELPLDLSPRTDP